MRYFIDTEFIERPCTIDLISLGIVREDGNMYYAESLETNWAFANDWVIEHVKPNLIGDSVSNTLAGISGDVHQWIGDDTPEFWGYYADYDWVVFCWLFGTMMDLPPGWPMYCRDLKQLLDERNISREAINQQVRPAPTTHNALDDARWVRHVYYWVTRHDDNVWMMKDR